MFRFFRKLRQNLLGQHRVTRYLLYAVGEIVLVVIGILIALQINNWNEGRKEQALEVALLQELKSDLEFSRKDLSAVMSTNQRYLEGYRQIHEAIEKDRPYDTALDSAFTNLDVWGQPYLSTTTYETLKTRGIDIIRNDSLKQHIQKVYNLHIQSLMEDMMKWEWSFNQNTTQRMMVGRIRRNLNNGLARPIDFEGLKKDEEFRNFLAILITLRNDNVSYTRKTLAAMESLIGHIDQEIESRNPR